MSASASASAAATDGAAHDDNLAIDSRHHSTSHKKVIKAAFVAYDKYAAGHKPALQPLAQTTAADFCDKRNVQKFAHYLVYTALAKGSKEPLSESTVDNYLSAVMNAAKERFSETHGDFFLVLGGRNSSITTPNNWLQQLSFNVGIDRNTWAPAKKTACQKRLTTLTELPTRGFAKFDLSSLSRSDLSSNPDFRSF
jgi:hypothetical protein